MDEYQYEKRNEPVSEERINASTDAATPPSTAQESVFNEGTATDAIGEASSLSTAEPPVFSEQPQVYQSPIEKENNAFRDVNNDYYATSSANLRPPIKGSVGGITMVICVLLSLVVGAVSGLFAASVVVSSERAKWQQEGTLQQPPTGGDVTITVDETVNSSVEAVAAKVTPSVVGIRTIASVQSFFGGSSEATGEGSGIIYSGDGYIVTNYHVIKSAVETARSSIEVYLAGDTDTAVLATVVGYNISYDLAVIKIAKTGLPAVTVGDVSNLRPGQYCVAIGAPGGLEFMSSVTNGIISGLNRSLGNTTGEKVPLIQTNAAINPGNSGGALVNLKGELIGVNSSKIVSDSYEGMGFAIPADTMAEICDKIIAKEYNPDPYVGITFSELWPAERLSQYGYPVGAVVKSVTEGDPAYSAGIRSGDIITEFNGRQVDSVEAFNTLLSQCKPGSSVSVKYYRSGRVYATAVSIGSNNSQ